MTGYLKDSEGARNTASAWQTFLVRLAIVGVAAATVVTPIQSLAKDAEVSLIPATFFFIASPPFILPKVAQAERIYEKAGLEVHLLNTHSANAATQLVAAGRASGLMAASSAVILATAKQKPMRIVGGIINHNISSLFASNDSGLPFNGTYKEKILALRGKRIGLNQLGSAYDNRLTRMMRAGGVTNPATFITRVAAGPLENQIAQMKHDRIDVFIGQVPAAALVERSGVGRPYITLDEMPAIIRNEPAIMAYTSAEQLEANPELYRRWRAALEMTAKWIADPANQQQLAKYVREYTLPQFPLDVSEDAAKAIADYYRGINPGLKLPRAAYESAVEGLKELGTLPDKPANSIKYDDVVIRDAQM